MLSERKILFVTQNIAPYRGKWLDELAKHIQVDIFHLGELSSKMDPALLSDKYKGKAKDYDVSRLLFGKYRVFRHKEIKKHAHDILILDGYGFLGQMLLIIALRLRKAEFYMSIDGGFIREKEPFLARMMKRFFLSGPKGYFSTSSLTDDYISHYAAKPGKLYRHYFSSVHSSDICSMQEKAECYSAYRSELGLTEEITVLTVGQFIPRKGFDILLKASRMTGSHIRYIFIGGVPPKDYVALIDDINQDSVQFIDFLDRQQLRKYYLSCDIFVFPTREDIWGLAVGEAMAYGCPVISSDKCVAALSMIKDGENGFIVHGESPGQYAAYIEKLAEDENMRSRMTEQNLEKIRAYAIDVSCKNDVESLQDIFAGKS